MSIITEGTSKINIKLPKKDVNRTMKVFYNPAMESNRNVAIVLLNSIDNEKMNLADPLAGSGIRSIRFLKELKKNKINHLFVNDQKDNFPKTLQQNLNLNKLDSKNVSVFNEDANLFLLNRVSDQPKPENFCGYFDFIDLDPFGSPNPFLSAAIARICRNGVLAVTATDTAALTGTYPKATERKYWSTNIMNYMMHELGLRILIRKIQLQAMQFDKVLLPILAYYKDHYFRIYFRSLKGKEFCSKIIKQHNYLLYHPETLVYEWSTYNYKAGFVSIGPLWTGKLFDKKLLRLMIRNNPFSQEVDFLKLLSLEKDQVGFYDLHELAKKYKLDTPKLKDILKQINGTRTHFSLTGIKTNKRIDEIITIVRDLSK